ncbi:MAG: carboxypeptidase-like regulatory domain-containing protein [Candidatus Micrarchaeia archaeon]
MRPSALGVVLILLTCSVVFASWTEKVEVHAVDAKNRPLKGAVISVSYQKNNFPVTESSLDGRFNVTTNETGMVLLSFSNQVQVPEYEERYYILRAYYQDETSTQEEKIKCTSMGPRCHDTQPFLKTFFFDAYRIEITVMDQNGEPIEGADVYIGSQHYQTGSDGKVWINSLNGKPYSITVEYAGKKRTITGSISGKDAEINVAFPRYDIKFRVIDDNGYAVSSEVLLDGMSAKADENGYVYFNNVIADNVQVMLRYANGVKRYNITLTGNIDTELVVDERPPTITSVNKEINEKMNAIFISASVKDPGVKASGLRDTDPIRLRYKVGEEGWKSIQMYTIGKDAYQASIPLVYDTKIYFEIEAYDKQENANSYTDYITVKKGDKGAGEPIVGDQKPPENATGERGGVDIITLIAGIVIFIVILLIIYKKYTGEI